MDAYLEQHGVPPRPPQLKNKGSAQVWAATQPDGNALLIIYAAILEAGQLYSPGRHASFLDLAFSSGGVVVAGLILWMVRSRRMLSWLQWSASMHARKEIPQCPLEPPVAPGWRDVALKNHESAPGIASWMVRDMATGVPTSRSPGPGGNF